MITSTTSPTQAILEVCGLDHPILRTLVDRRIADRHLVDFKLCPILPTARRPPRLYLSWDGEKKGWIQRVRRCFDAPELDRFLASVPASCRRMIDTDGTTAELYLDDLHLHGHAEMCRILAIPGFHTSRLVIADRPPDPVAPLLAPFLELGGILANRQGHPVPRAVWVSEARWNGQAGAAVRVLEQLDSLPPHFRALQAALKPFRLRLYVDAVDAYDGALDVTVGLLADSDSPRINRGA